MRTASGRMPRGPSSALLAVALALLAAGLTAVLAHQRRVQPTGLLAGGGAQADATTTTTAAGAPRTVVARAATAAGPRPPVLVRSASTSTTRPQALVECTPADVMVTLEQNKRLGEYEPSEKVGLVAKARNTSGHPCSYPDEVSVGVSDPQNATVWGATQRLAYPADGGPSAPADWEPGYGIIRYFTWDQRECTRADSCGVHAPPGRYTAKAAFHARPGADVYAYGEGATVFELRA